MQSGNFIFNKSFFKDVINLTSGYAVSQLIVIAFSPLLTRLYNPAEFGVFFFFITTASILSIIATGGYEKAIVVAEKESDARDLIRYSVLLSFFISLITALIIVFLQFCGKSFFETRTERTMLLLVPVYSLFFGIFRIMQNWNIRGNRFKAVSTSFIVRSSTQSVVQAGLGAAGMASPGLILGSCLGQMAAVFMQMKKEKLFRGLFNREKRARAKELAGVFSDYPKFRMSSDLINEVSIQAPIYVLKTIFSNAATGLYTFPQKILYQPSKFISQAVADVFFNKASRMNSRNKDLGELTYSTFKNLMLIGVIPYMIILLWGPEIFSFIFSKEWMESGKIASFLCPWMFLVFVGSPVSGIFLVDNRLRLSFILNFLLLFFRLSALLYGAIVLKDVTGTIILFSAVSTIYWVATILYSLHFAGVKIRRAIIFSLLLLAAAAVLLLPFKLFIK